MSSPFQLSSDYSPKGDQGQAIAKLVKSIEAGNRHQTLYGVTGSGKTFSMANIIQKIGKPTLIMSHNKTLAAQLYSEFKNFFPHNAVEYFVSYFDYYQPEAYIPRSDTYIEKDSSINDEIERLRLSTMGSLLTRNDTIVIASVSCIYGLGSPDDYKGMMLPCWVGQEIGRDDFLAELVSLLFERNDVAFGRGKFRVRGDVVEIHPAYLDDTAIRVEFFGDEVDRISSINSLTGTVIDRIENHTFYPAKQFVTSKEVMKTAMVKIKEEMKSSVEAFEKEKKLVEAQRIRMRTEYDLEMMEEMGFCQGIENYSRHLTGRQPGDTPYSLLDFFKEDSLVIIDESHATIPQVRGMYAGDQSRKSVLVEHGFRLPSAMDNRPLKFDEFMDKTCQRLYVSATPGPFEIVNSRADNKGYLSVIADEERGIEPIRLRDLKIQPSTSFEKIDQFNPKARDRQLIVEQIIRPTGLLDPVLEFLPLIGQIDATIELCHDRVAKNERVLITTLTKRTAEDLSEYLQGAGLRVSYIHADIDTVERVEILRALRAGEFDILVGINLLREGLDLPEVSLICILDADKEGFLRNETSLIQTAGRAARHLNGRCVLFCDVMTDSIKRLIEVTNSRRARQISHNEKHGITPQSVKRAVQESLQQYSETKQSAEAKSVSLVAEDELVYNAVEVLKQLQEEMLEASGKLEFERAAHLRDQISELQNRMKSQDVAVPAKKVVKKVSYRKKKS